MTTENAETLRGLVELTAEDLVDATAQYQRLLGVDAGEVEDDGLVFDDFGLRLRAATDSRRSAGRFLLEHPAPERFAGLLRRRGLALADCGDDTLVDPAQPAVGVLTRDFASTRTPIADDLIGVDHLVFTSGNRDEAVALFAGVLGLDFRLDQAIFDGVRQLFFRGHGVVSEVVVNDGPITFLGIAWKSADLEASRERLVGQGISVTEIRSGRKKGTRVATVKEPGLLIPTLLIE